MIWYNTAQQRFHLQSQEAFCVHLHKRLWHKMQPVACPWPMSWVVHDPGRWRWQLVCPAILGDLWTGLAQSSDTMRVKAYIQSMFQLGAIWRVALLQQHKDKEISWEILIITSCPWHDDIQFSPVWSICKTRLKKSDPTPERSSSLSGQQATQRGRKVTSRRGRGRRSRLYLPVTRLPLPVGISDGWCGGGGPSKGGSATSRRGGDPPSGKVLGPKDTSKPLSTCPHFWSQVAQVNSETEKWFSISSKKRQNWEWFMWTKNFSGGPIAYIRVN